MTTNTYTIPASSDGLKLSILTVTPDQAPKAVVQLVHGMCEHKERYLPLMEYLASRGYICVINDLRGHGESVLDKADLGYFYKGGWKALVEDEKWVTDWIKTKYENLPVMLFGHSMGSLVVRCYCKKHDDAIKGLIVCGSPSANPAVGLGKALALCIRAVNGWRYRSPMLVSMTTGTYARKFKKEASPNSWICTDPTVVEAYDADPLCGFPFTVNGYYGLFNLLQHTYSVEGWQLRNKTLPILFIAGAKDPCIESLKKFSRASALLREVGYANVNSKVYPGMRHEIHNEAGKQAVWEDIGNALDVWTKR